MNRVFWNPIVKPTPLYFELLREFNCKKYNDNLPLVSIVIPAYNSGKYIGECLQSVINQTYTNWECFIVLAPCTDNTLDEIWKCINVDDPNPKIRIIREDKKSNCATARNKGFNECSGKYVTFLDADDWWEPQNLERMVMAMENYINSDLDWCVHCQKMHKDNKEQIIMEMPGTHNEIGGIGGILFKKETLDKIKSEYGYVFDESLKHTDDGDLSLRLRKYKGRLFPEVLSHYRWNESGLTATTGNINQSWGIVKILIKRGAWDLLPYHLKNLGVCIVEEVTGFDLVRKR
ncbi:MAG: glycosyltransferase family A protein [Candidatus Paceibacterota bacterium]|jgi:glycosyltransferase involved in cell wall biosynthesis